MAERASLGPGPLDASTSIRRVNLLAVLLPCALWASLLALRETTFWSVVCDDSFYYFQIARHIASGHGATFDGLQPTNGYHPLWLGVCVVLYAAGVGSDAAPVALVLFQVLLCGVSWVLLGSVLSGVCRVHPHRADRVIRRAIPVALAACTLAQPLLRVWVNGLESAAALLFQVTLLRLAVGHELLAPTERRARLCGGLLIAGAFLSRTDAALLLGAIVLWALPALVRQPRAIARALLEWLLLPTLVVVAYMVANHVLFGSAMQVSGLVKRLPLGAGRVVGAVVLFAVVWMLFARLPRATFPRTTDLLRRTGFFAPFVAMLCAVYVALGAFPRLWYFGPLLLLAMATGICLLLDLMARAADERSETEPGVAVRPLAMIFGTVAVGTVTLGGWQAVTAPQAPPLWANRDAGRYIAAHLPRDAVLASWDAGVVGYHARRRVVNLDGVASSAEYLSALKAGRTAELLRPIPIGWVVNHGDRATGEASLRAHARALLGARVEGMRLVQTWPFSVFGGVNRSVPTANEMQVYLFRLVSPRVVADRSGWDARCASGS